MMYTIFDTQTVSRCASCRYTWDRYSYGTPPVKAGGLLLKGKNDY